MSHRMDWYPLIQRQINAARNLRETEGVHRQYLTKKLRKYFMTAADYYG